jgi:hypothetical protein
MAVTENPFSRKLQYQHDIYAENVEAIDDHVIVKDMDFGQRTLNSGVIMLGDDGKTDGIRPRWGQVYKVGPKQKDFKVGQWILLEHGRWTRGFHVKFPGEDEPVLLRRADINAVMLVSDEEPTDIETISTAVHSEQKERVDWENYE